MKKDEESCPEEYTIDNYYKEDELGRSVLEMKYLAPGEKILGNYPSTSASSC